MMSKTDLHQAFWETRYVVKTGGPISEAIVLRIGQNAKTLEDALPHANNWAFITAANPLPEILTPDENQNRQDKLRKLLKEMGYIFYEGVGVSADAHWQEDSMLIVNITRKDANTIAHHFGQMAFVYGTLRKVTELVYTEP
jgi:hypothetical protein